MGCQRDGAEHTAGTRFTPQSRKGRHEGKPGSGHVCLGRQSLDWSKVAPFLQSLFQIPKCLCLSFCATLGPVSGREGTEAEERPMDLVWEAQYVPYCKRENTIRA